jgi:hypothetical protein
MNIMRIHQRDYGKAKIVDKLSIEQIAEYRERNMSMWRKYRCSLVNPFPASPFPLPTFPKGGITGF